MTEIFDFMKDISYKEYDSFMKAVDKKRQEMLLVNKNLLTDKKIYFDINKTEKIPNGRFNIIYKKILFECVFHFKQSQKLYVILNGALTMNPPQFSRWSYCSFLDGSMLNLADPMYHIYTGLKLGWYYGSSEYDLRVYIAEIVKKIAEILNIKEQNIIFFGSSGGGAATIELASLINGARAVAINPQMILSEYDYGKEFMEITNNNLVESDIWHRNDGIYWINFNEHSYHILIFNLRSNSDMLQVKNICDRLCVSVKYGINKFGHTIIWIYDAECDPFVSPHSTQEFYCIIFAVEFLLKNVDTENFDSKYGSFFRLVNEFWYLKWQQEKLLRMEIIDISKLVMCRECGKKIILWGSGEIAVKVSNSLLDISGNNYYKIQMVVDNNKDKVGTYFMDCVPIKHPSILKHWKEYFVIVAVNRGCTEIFYQLELLNMDYEADYIHWTDLIKKQ